MRNGDYILLRAPNEYPGKKYRGMYAYEHHLVWWEHTGEVLKESECIHHLNHDKHDNRIANLEKLSVVDHARKHAADKPKQMVGWVCRYCRKPFQIEKRNLPFRLRNSKYGLCCSRSCAGKNAHKHKGS